MNTRWDGCSTCCWFRGGAVEIGMVSDSPECRDGRIWTSAAVRSLSPMDSQMLRVQTYPHRREYKHLSIALHEYAVTYHDPQLPSLPPNAASNVWEEAMMLEFGPIASITNDLQSKKMSERCLLEDIRDAPWYRKSHIEHSVGLSSVSCWDGGAGSKLWWYCGC